MMASVDVSSVLSTSAVGKSQVIFDIKLTADRTDRQTGALYLLGSLSPAAQKSFLLLSNRVDAVDQVKLNPTKGTTSGLEKLEGLAPDFRIRARHVLLELNGKGHNLRVIWGKRTKAENDKLVKQETASHNSKHLTGKALDFVSRTVGYDNLKYPIYTAETAVAARNAGVIWGGNFISRWDPNHIESQE